MQPKEPLTNEIGDDTGPRPARNVRSYPTVSLLNAKSDRDFISLSSNQ